jgi:hypothetical protein
VRDTERGIAFLLKEVLLSSQAEVAPGEAEQIAAEEIIVAGCGGPAGGNPYTVFRTISVRMKGFRGDTERRFCEGDAGVDLHLRIEDRVGAGFLGACPHVTYSGRSRGVLECADESPVGKIGVPGTWVEGTREDVIRVGAHIPSVVRPGGLIPKFYLSRETCIGDALGKELSVFGIPLYGAFIGT